MVRTIAATLRGHGWPRRSHRKVPRRALGHVALAHAADESHGSAGLSPSVSPWKCTCTILSREQQADLASCCSARATARSKSPTSPLYEGSSCPVSDPMTESGDAGEDLIGCLDTDKTIEESR